PRQLETRHRVTLTRNGLAQAAGAAWVGRTRTEWGYQGSVHGKSVTALEIEFGVLNNPAQARYSRFYFRKPLRGEVPPSDRYAGELDQLKRRIRARLPDRVLEYEAEWDAAGRRLTGLERFGELVKQDLRRDLADFSRDDARPEPASWDQQESVLLEGFVAARSTGFNGRQEVQERLQRFAAGEAGPEAKWLAVVHGESGSGKSAVFAELVRRLHAADGILVLAHAVGISPRSAELAFLLRRWILVLARFLGDAPPDVDSLVSGELERQFETLLGRAAARRRVLCLIDGLDHFAVSAGARGLQWLPARWPENARLAVTSIPGAGANALLRRPEALDFGLGALSRTEIVGIVAASCERHHAAVSDAVRDELAERWAPANGRGVTPLWLELALGQLLVLDLHDLEEARQRHTGEAEDRLHSYRLELSRSLPNAVDGMYACLLQRIRRACGSGWTDAVAELLSASRSGFRETDLKRLVPLVAGFPWDDLNFAHLRRAFRGQMVQWGALAQWTLAHRQAAKYLSGTLPRNTGRAVAIHRLIAGYLQNLPAADELRRSELMHHLIEGDLPRIAAEHYRAIDPGDRPALEASTQALALFLQTGDEAGEGTALSWTLQLLTVPESPYDRQNLCARFLDFVAGALPYRPRVRSRLLEGIAKALEALRTEAGLRDAVERQLAVCLDRLGELHTASGAGKDGVRFHERAFALRRELWQREPHSRIAARDASVSLSRLMSALLGTGQLEEAMQFCQLDLEITSELNRHFPHDTEIQRDVMVSSALASELLQRKEDFEGARGALKIAFAAARTRRAAEPENAACACDLAGVLERGARLELAEGRPDAARPLFDEALGYRTAAYQRNPESDDDARRLMMLHSEIAGNYLCLAAEHEWRALELARELSGRMPGDSGRARDHAIAAGRFAAVLNAMGQEAGEFIGECSTVLESLPPRRWIGTPCWRRFAFKW
ncbi:MAG: hypothetical protein NTY38_05615, partial [Acidobacteria bacterium]|nr:hypothetical protein [Acidobacteriota bacterium]